MKSLLKLILVLACIFLSTFIIIKLTGILSLDQIGTWFVQAQQVEPAYLMILVIALLWLDLFIAVPTLTVLLLSGYFLGHTLGFIAACSGLLLAGLTGYGLSYLFGDRLLKRLLRKQDKIDETVDTFNRYGFVMLLLSRALPILPEVSACLAGMTKLPPAKFISAWCLSCLPYAFIASYSGSISSVSNPAPALYTAIGLTAGFALAWFVFSRYIKRKHTEYLS